MKYSYYKIIQSNHGFGWDDEDYHETNSAFILKDRASFKENFNAYMANCNAPLRVINRKEVNND